MDKHFRSVNKPLNLISKLANRALEMRLFDSVGQQILSLSEKDRETIKQLKSNDVKNVRWPPF